MKQLPTCGVFVNSFTSSPCRFFIHVIMNFPNRLTPCVVLKPRIFSKTGFQAVLEIPGIHAATWLYRLQAN